MLGGRGEEQQSDQQHCRRLRRIFLIRLSVVVEISILRHSAAAFAAPAAALTIQSVPVCRPVQIILEERRTNAN